MVLQNEALIGLVYCGIVIIVGCMFQFVLYPSTESESSESPSSAQPNWAEARKYVPKGISNAKTLSALSAEYYYLTMTVLSHLAVLLAIFISLCTLLWCTYNENGTWALKSLMSLLKAGLNYVNRCEVGTLLSSLAASINREFYRTCVHVLSTTRNILSSLKTGLFCINHKIGIILHYVSNTITTLILSMVARLRKTTNREVSDANMSDTVLRRQLLQANEQLSQERDKSLCIICLDAPREMLLKPCKHYCLCSDCSNELRDCPICKRGIQEAEKIYSA